jgi:3-oxoacyl-[acyl-carrier protein] reductase
MTPPSSSFSSASSATRLDGRSVLISGAGTGIGRGLAQAFAAAGAQVVVTARRRDTGRATLDLIEAEGGRGLAVEMDVTRRDQVDAAVAATLARYGRLDIVIHNANAGNDSALPVALEDITDALWDRQAQVAWDGAFHLAQASFAALKASGQGRFVMLGSAFGLHGAAMNPVYSSLKGGDRGFVKALAREWGPHGITVNAIEPAAITEPTEVFFNQYPAVKARYLGNFSMRRMGDPRHDIGRAVVAMCSSDFGYVTAQSIQIDGGLYTAL